jgi:hypothetical protein
MTVFSDMAAALISAGYGTAIGTDIFAYKFPGHPLIAYLILPYGGRGPDYCDQRTALDHPGFQVQVRHTTKSTAESRAEGIRAAMDLREIVGYVICRTTRSHAVDLTSPEDEALGVGRFSIDFELLKVR